MTKIDMLIIYHVKYNSVITLLYIHILLDDHTRVQLSITNYGDNDYINASWIDVRICLVF